MKQLTYQYKKFVCEYIKTLDSEKALKLAGFRVKNPKTFAQNLLEKDFIICEIKSQLNHQIESLNVHKGYVIQKLLQIAEFSLVEEDILDKDGNYTGKKKLRESSSGLKALEGLCKYLGFSTVKEDEKYRGTKIITIANLDDKKI